MSEGIHNAGEENDRVVDITASAVQAVGAVINQKAGTEVLYVEPDDHIVLSTN